MVSAVESPVHQNWKSAIIKAAETDTVFLNRFSRPGLRTLRTARTSRLEHDDHVGMEQFGTAKDLYFGGDMEASIALSGQVVGRIDEILPVQQIVHDTMRQFYEACRSLAQFVG